VRRSLSILGMLWFLAHLWRAYTIMRRPSSSVIRARFVTTGANDQKVCTYVPLGKNNWQTNFRSSLILSLATREPKPKSQKVVTLDELQLVPLGALATGPVSRHQILNLTGSTGFQYQFEVENWVFEAKLNRLWGIMISCMKHSQQVAH
jgi:hypothetical protein